MNLDDRVLFGVVLATGVIAPGVADYALSMTGHGTAGMVVWAVGYLAMVLGVWYRWVRPLDFTDPTGE